jgi:predicted glutamine amidotransferase
MIVSEPLDAEAHQWNDVPAGHVLVADTEVHVAPFAAGVEQRAFSFAK